MASRAAAMYRWLDERFELSPILDFLKKKSVPAAIAFATSSAERRFFS